MADINGNDGKPGENKTGPVKPPVLDIKPNETSRAETKPDTAKLDPKPAPGSAFTNKADPVRPKPAATKARRDGLGLGAALSGGVLGLAAAYGLAWAGYWPSAPASAPEAAPAADPRLAQFEAAIPELETVTQTTQSELAALNQRISALETAEPEQVAVAEPIAPSEPTEPAQPVDLGPIETELAALSERLDAVAATPPQQADEGAINELRETLSGLSARLDEVSSRVGTAEASLRTLDTTVSQTSAALAEQPDDIGAVLQLPLVLSGLETAFASGRPYEAELGALRAATPDTAVPTAIANQAETGLPRPDQVASRFAEVLPAMLAGRPVAADAGWQDGALDWFRSAIALRPTGEREGDEPEAVMSRLEAAIARRDFAAAETLLASLPVPMVTAAGDVPALIADQAEAARFLETVRAGALSGEVAQ